MIISCEKNSLIETNNETVISDGSNISFKGKNYFRVSYSDTPFTQTAIILDNKILKAENSVLVDLKRDKMLCFFKRYFYPEFTNIAHKNTNGVYISVYGDNFFKINIKTNYENKIFTYNYKETNTNIEFFTINSTPLALVYLKTVKILKVFNIANEVKEILSVKADDYEITNKLYVTTTYNDIVGHVKQTEYDFDNGLKIKNFTLKLTRVDPLMIKKELLPIAFFEEILVGGSVHSYLGGNMSENINAISGYLGDFKAVCPSPFGGLNEVGLMYEGGETGCDFTLRLIQCELKNAKIENISFVT